MHSNICNPQYYLAIVLACFVLAVIILIAIAWLCIYLCERQDRQSVYSIDLEALLEECVDCQDRQDVGPLSAMRVLSGASLLSALAPKSVRPTDMDFSNW